MSDNSGPAFPYSMLDPESHGLTKREWFAGLAMQATLPYQLSINRLWVEDWDKVAALAFATADAMIAMGVKSRSE